MPEFHDWESFYVIVGAAAGALIGLQFVVVTLIAERPQLRGGQAGAAFLTPTIVHFSLSLLLCALMRAPWHGMTPLAWTWGLTGVGGLIYTGVATWRMRNQSIYVPVFEDWLFHALLPLAAYAALVLSAFAVPLYECVCLFAVGSVALLLLMIGIHNAWDGIAYHVFVRMEQAASDEPPEKGEQ